jgi:hypothetical protein
MGKVGALPIWDQRDRGIKPIISRWMESPFIDGY